MLPDGSLTAQLRDERARTIAMMRRAERSHPGLFEDALDRASDCLDRASVSQPMRPGTAAGRAAHGGTPAPIKRRSPPAATTSEMPASEMATSESRLLRHRKHRASAREQAKAEAVSQIRRRLRARAYTAQGLDLVSLFHQYESFESPGAISMESFRGAVRRDAKIIEVPALVFSTASCASNVRARCGQDMMDDAAVASLFCDACDRAGDGSSQDDGLSLSGFVALLGAPPSRQIRQEDGDRVHLQDGTPPGMMRQEDGDHATSCTRHNASSELKTRQIRRDLSAPAPDEMADLRQEPPRAGEISGQTISPGDVESLALIELRRQVQSLQIFAVDAEQRCQHAVQVANTLQAQVIAALATLQPVAVASSSPCAAQQCDRTQLAFFRHSTQELLGIYSHQGAVH